MKKYIEDCQVAKNANYTTSIIDKLHKISKSLEGDLILFNLSLQPDTKEWIDWERLEFIALPEELKFLSDVSEIFEMKSNWIYQRAKSNLLES
jgi:hypothetical protein